MKKPGQHVRRVGKSKEPRVINAGVPRASLVFYDLKTRKKFTTGNYKVVTKVVRGKQRKFAVATTPSGITAWRITS